MRAPVQQVQFLQRRGSKAIDEDGDTISLTQAKVGDHRVEDLICNLVGGSERTTVDAGFAVDADADFHLSVG